MQEDTSSEYSESTRLEDRVQSYKNHIAEQDIEIRDLKEAVALLKRRIISLS